MPPTPISQNTVNLAITYITPPSQITQPLPPFILSKALLQRHHFLSVSYDDPVDYLSWPADTSAKAVELLELLPTPIEDHAPASYPTHYSTDGEYVYAHIAVFPPERDGVRLVFQWDDPDGWKFHDLKTMPFPHGSSPSLLQALNAAANSAAAEAVPELSYGARPTHDPYAHEHDNDSGSGDDDDYWNAYGAADSSGNSPTHHPLPLKDDGGDSEDAYWARYASVQGTADSTIPSPRDPRRRPGGAHDPEHSLSGPTGDYDHPLISVVPMNKQGPASPSTLARLLSDVSPRRSPAPCFESDLDKSGFLSEEADTFREYADFGDYAVSGPFNGEVVGQDAGPEYTSLGLGLRGVGVGLGAGEDRALSPPCDGSEDSDETPSPPGEDERNGVGALGLTQDLADSFGQNEPISAQASKAELLGTYTEKGECFASGVGSAPAESALRDRVKGLYTLWQTTARTHAGGASEKEAFMRVVADAIGHSA